MQRVKLFTGLENDVQAVEDEINAWLEKTGAKVLTISGNIAPQSQVTSKSPGLAVERVAFAPSDVFVMVLYEAP